MQCSAKIPDQSLMTDKSVKLHVGPSLVLEAAELCWPGEVSLLLLGWKFSFQPESRASTAPPTRVCTAGCKRAWTHCETVCTSALGYCS